MVNKKQLKTFLFEVFILLVILSCGVGVTWKPYPPETFQETDLPGIWEAKYCSGKCVDRIILKADGAYKQIYQDSEGYTYESPWNKWSVETLSDNSVYLHLSGMQFFADGRKVAEEGGLDPFGKPHYFYDRNRDDFVQMLGENILRIGTDDMSDNIVLIQMEYDSDASTPRAFNKQLP